MASTFQPHQPVGRQGSLADVLSQMRAQKKQQLQGLLQQSNAAQTPMSLMAPNQVHGGLFSNIVNGILGSAGQGLGNKAWQGLSGALSGSATNAGTDALAASMGVGTAGTTLSSAAGAAETAGAGTALESAAMYAPSVAAAGASAPSWLESLLALL